MSEWVMWQRVLHYWVFSIGPDYFFAKNRYSWISHANLAIWWWKSSKISSSTVVDQYFFCMSCKWFLNSNYPWILLCYCINNNEKPYWLYLKHLLDFIKLKTLWCSRLLLVSNLIYVFTQLNSVKISLKPIDFISLN